MKIKCPSCDQRLEIPEELAGQTIECPACNTGLSVPNIAKSSPAPVTPSPIQKSAPQSTSGYEKKLSIPKWAIASGACCILVGISAITLFSSSENEDDSDQNIGATNYERMSQQTGQKPFASLANFSKQKSDAKKLSTAIENNNVNEVKALLDDGIDPSGKSAFRSGRSPDLPLLQAISVGNKEIVELLIDRGVDVNDKISFQGGTALHEAARQHRKEIIELLISKGADVNAQSNDDFFGITPVDSAYKGYGSKKGRITPPKTLEKKRKEIADLLRKHGGKTGAELKAEGK